MAYADGIADISAARFLIPWVRFGLYTDWNEYFI
jgi:hypothetical protein